MMTRRTKSKIDEVFERLHVQPVGNGYIDCICQMQDASAFVAAMNTLGVKITGFTWWCFVQEGHEPCGMGGPRNNFGSGWYSEISMGEVHEFANNEAVEKYLLIDWPQNKNFKSCFTPAFWLDVPDSWKNPWAS